MNKPVTTPVLLALCVLIYTAPATAQLSGAKTIPGDFATIAQAIDSLNALGVGPGGVVFDVAAGHTETAANLLLTDATSSAAGGITFRKSGTGANPLITAGTGVSTTIDGFIRILGTDHLIFDGIDLYDGNPADTSQMEWGYALLKASGSNGSQHVVIRNCTITLNKTNPYATGIYSNNHTAASTSLLTVVSAAGTHSDNHFTGNTVTNVQAGIALLGYNQPSSPYAFYDQRTIIGGDTGNVITDFGGGSTNCYGIYTTYQNDLRVEGNVISGGAVNTGVTRGIYTSSALNANTTIARNTITMATAATTNAVYALQNASGGSGSVPGTTNRIIIADNIIENAALLSVTTGAVYMIYQTGVPADVEITGNIVRNNSRAGTGTFYLLYQAGDAADSALIGDNTISRNSAAGNSLMYGIYCHPGGGTTSIVEGNTVHGNSSGASSALHHGIAMSSGLTNVVTRNTVDSLSTAGGALLGISHTSTTSGMTGFITRNEVYNLTGTGTNASVSGINVISGATVYLVNNFISDLRAPVASNTFPAVAGIDVDGGSTIGIYHNSVFLNASSTDGLFSSAGLYTATPPTVDLRNNTIVNLSTPGSTAGITFAYRRGGSGLPTLALSTNNNNYYAGTPSATRVIFGDGGSVDSTIAQYQSRVGPRESASFSEMSPFMNAVAPPYNLHINTAVPTQLDSGGTPVTIPIAVAEDIDGEPRDPSLPDVGADEFTATSPDAVPPVIVYTPPGSTTSTSDRILSAAITDTGGVAGGGNAPRLYYRKTTDTSWAVNTASAPVGDDYTFTFAYALLGGGSVSPGDTILYYVAAQDLSGNAGTQPAGGSGSTPPGTVPPPAPGSYAILPLPPECAGVLSPADADTGVAVTANLVWTAPGGPNPATGYRLYLGTDNPPTNLVNGADLGNVLTYDPLSDLAYSTQHYWRIVPYNAEGDATGCPVWSFTTGPDPTITAFPYEQGFETASFPPYGWITGGGKSWTRHTGADVHSGTAAASVAALPAGEAILAMPPVNLPAGHRIRFWWRDDDITAGPRIEGSDTTFFEISMDAGSTWTALAFLSAPAAQPAYAEAVLDLSPYAGAGVLMRWRDVSDGTTGARGAGLDDIRIEATTAAVTFRVNMKGKMLEGTFLPDSGDVVTVRGSFNDWGNSTNNPDTLTDADNDSVYVKQIALTPGPGYEYKFWKTLRGGLAWEDGISNRLLDLGTGDTVLPAPWFNDEPPPVDVTFRVDMSVQMLQGAFAPGLGDVVTVRGSFNDWGISTNNPDTLEDGDLDSVYTLVRPTPPDSVQYKFWKTERGGSGYENSIGNRIAVIDSMPLVLATVFFDGDSVMDLGFDVSAGWDMIARPLITDEDSVSALFPGSSLPYAFTFTTAAGYVQRSVLDIGPGYWAKFDSAHTVVLPGAYVFEDSIPVTPGWNMIGSISLPVDTGMIVQTPPGIVGSLYFGYSAGYFADSLIRPGRAYWVKAAAPGSLFLRNEALPVPLARSRAAGAPPPMNSITISDGRGGAQTLWFGRENSTGLSSGFFDMPPPAPEGVLDARFASGRMLELFGEGAADLPVAVRSTGPVTVTWRIVDDPGGRLLLRSGAGHAVRMEGEGAVVLPAGAAGGLVISLEGAPVPAAFALGQSYPNPFNPVARFEFRIAEWARVRIAVYDLLGREVATLVDGMREPGVYLQSFDASHLASGTYLYRLTAGGYTETRRMILLR